MYHGEFPIYVVMFSARAFLSMAACVVVFLGLWVLEHKWDEEGSEEYDRAQGSEARAGMLTTTHGDYTAAPANGGQLVKTGSRIPNADMIIVGDVVGVYEADIASRTSGTSSKNQVLVRVPTVDAEEQRREAEPTSSSSPDVQVPLELLEKAYPQPNWVFAGFVLWAFSGFCHPEHGFFISAWNVFSFILLLLFGWLFFPLRTATIKRDFKIKKRVISLMVLIAFLLAIAGMLEKKTSAPWQFCAFGALCILASYPLLWRHRKMGMSWDMEGKPNREGAVVQNLGCLLLLFGLFLFWVGTNAITDADVNSKHLPIFVSSRVWLAFAAGLVLIVPSTLALEYALDQGSQPVEAGRIGPVVLFRLNGQTFAGLGATRLPLLATEPISNAVESPLTFFLLGWILLGWSCFLPLGNSGTGVTVQKVFVLLFCIAIGVVDAVLLQPAFWQAASEAHQKWSYLYFGLLFWLAVTIGVKGGAQLTLSVLGAMFLFIGQKISWKDRNPGLQPQEDSPAGQTKQTVFGTSQPIVIMGWILLCLSLSIPM